MSGGMPRVRPVNLAVLEAVARMDEMRRRSTNMFRPDPAELEARARARREGLKERAKAKIAGARRAVERKPR